MAAVDWYKSVTHLALFVCARRQQAAGWSVTKVSPSFVMIGVECYKSVTQLRHGRGGVLQKCHTGVKKVSPSFVTTVVKCDISVTHWSWLMFAAATSNGEPSAK
jgi:hypothetical protein